MLLVAIDPGKSGGFAICSNGNVTAEKMADSAADIFNQLPLNFGNNDSAIAWLEHVHAMPGDGAKSMFTFGQNFGRLEMALAAHAIPYELVSPNKWMKKFGSLPIDKSERKKAIKAKVQARFPHIKVTLATADALAMLMVMMEKYREVS